jgi:class 3 adenylate cyclase
MEQDWELYTQILGRLMAGWNDADAGVLGSIICSSHTPASFQAVSSHLVTRASSEWCAEIRAPVLLLHSIGDEAESAVARQMASAISNCRVLAIPRLGYGASAEGLGGPYPNEVGLTAVLDFIAAPEKAEVEVQPDVGLRTILFTDLVDHTQMMTRLGDEKGREVLREHERITREALAAHGGSEVKTMGDGFMASFTSVTNAVGCAIDLQRAFEGNETGLRVRIGLNAGEPIEDEGDLFGSTVILAARIASIAEAGEILVSDVIRQLLSGKAFLFNDRGEHPVKGFEDPVRVFAVRWQGNDS